MNILGAFKKAAKKGLRHNAKASYRLVRRNLRVSVGIGITPIIIPNHYPMALPIAASVKWAGKERMWTGMRFSQLMEHPMVQKIFSTAKEDEAEWARMFGTEGLRDEGIAQVSRHSQTDFGSGWQGIRKIARQVENIYGEAAMISKEGRVRFRPTRRQALEIAKNVQQYGGVGQMFAEGAESDVFGLGAGHVFKLSEPSANFAGVEGVLQPVYRQSFGKFEASVFPRVQPLAGGTRENFPMIKGLVNKLDKQGYIWEDIEAKNVGLFRGEPVILDPGYIYRNTLTAPRTPQIEALRHRGVAPLMRKKVTGFGSGWQGLQFNVSHSGGDLIKKTEIQIFKGKEKVGWLSGTREAGSSSMLIDEAELAHELRGKGLGKEMYRRLFETAQESNVTKVVSGGVVSEEAQHVWRSLAKAGAPISETMGKAGATFQADLLSFTADSYANLTKLEQTTRTIMKSGEGAAIARAGTAEVPSLLRKTARILKNAL